ncbi:hypothetical protein GCM10009757_48900 [Streptomyces cheonanensis]|uniref:Uncharacterized protein n=1 Tax=Streptomyces cheonanensis TaxID=312720 RepID=A0ABN2VJ70_9ACTN
MGGNNGRPVYGLPHGPPHALSRAPAAPVVRPAILDAIRTGGGPDSAGAAG